ncbi:conserved hypothetical protein [Marinobacter daqiaonensis]|uniref:Purine nucleoside phosphorylase n=1 Tax=Marinobacter daqiaonensis TaxID=650891 RepID=A0A1I6K608_9GAMM|nr:peptidoglycan editing factor PgeF [Marinobacter daqiaonensis]SFR86627.1 conserved hypothetical protein [Marinobacter daqiaonensis]
MSAELPVLHPDWPAPASVQTLCTTREGGVSSAPWDTLNLGTHVGDNHGDVLENRRRLAVWTRQEPENFGWLQQVHGTTVAELPVAGVPSADGAVTQAANTVCAILTADCLPVLFCDQGGRRVGAAHAGWRGLADGVLEQVAGWFPRPSEVLAWLGPAIGPARFEVGPEVRRRFLEHCDEADVCFTPAPHRPDHYLADIYGLARLRLTRAGVTRIYGGDFCTMTDDQRFFSYRRDGETGRMASCIWLTS